MGSTYVHYVAGGIPGGQPAPAQYLAALDVRPRESHMVTRLRVSSYPLRVMTGRYETEEHDEGGTISTRRLPRGRRTCQVCRQPHVEDLQHFLLHCPTYTHIRARRQALFAHGSTAGILSHHDRKELTEGIAEMLAFRKGWLALWPAE